MVWIFMGAGFLSRWREKRSACCSICEIACYHAFHNMGIDIHHRSREGGVYYAFRAWRYHEV